MNINIQIENSNEVFFFLEKCVCVLKLRLNDI